MGFYCCKDCGNDKERVSVERVISFRDRTFKEAMPDVYIATMYSTFLEKEFISCSLNREYALEDVVEKYNDATGEQLDPEDAYCFKYAVARDVSFI